MDISDEQIEAFYNEPQQRAAEVTVAHRMGFWNDWDLEDVTTEMIQQADDYLEAHIQWRIEQVRVGGDTRG